MRRESFETSHVTFDETHHQFVGTENFDFDAVDEALGFIAEAPPSAREQAAELLRRLLTWCFNHRGSLRSALIRFTAISAGLRPDLLENRSGRELASALGVTKQAFAHASLKFSDAFGIKFARSRSKEDREHMRAARLGGPCRNHGKERARKYEATRSHHAA
jgi:hypothetical protein